MKGKGRGAEEETDMGGYSSGSWATHYFLVRAAAGQARWSAHPIARLSRTNCNCSSSGGNNINHRVRQRENLKFQETIMVPVLVTSKLLEVSSNFKFNV